MNDNRATCACELCGTPTPMLGTRRCDRCWELQRRIRSDPELARRILDKLEGPAGVRAAITHYVPYHRERDDFDWDALHRAEDHEDRKYDMAHGWQWVGIVAPAAPSLPVRAAPTPEQIAAGVKAMRDNGWHLDTDELAQTMPLVYAAMMGVQNRGEGETGKDGVNGPLTGQEKSHG